MAMMQRFAIPSAKGLIFSPFYGFIARETEIIAEIGSFDCYDFSLIRNFTLTTYD